MTERKTAEVANAMYDPARRCVIVDVTTPNGERIALELVYPELLADSLRAAMAQRSDAQTLRSIA